MDKDTIISYLDEISFKMKEGKFIQAHETLKWTIQQIDYDVKNDAHEKEGEQNAD